MAAGMSSAIAMIFNMEMWQDSEVWELLAVCGEERIRWKMTSTVRDNVVYANITRQLNERNRSQTK